MGEYKRKLSQRLKFEVIGVVVFIVLSIVMFTRKSAGDHFSEYARGYQFGICFGIALKLVIDILSKFKATKDERRLKELYISASDERASLIEFRTFQFTFKFCLYGLFISTFIASFYDYYIMMTLVTVIVVMSVVKLGAGLYFKKVI